MSHIKRVIFVPTTVKVKATINQYSKKVFNNHTENKKRQRRALKKIAFSRLRDIF